VDMRVGLAGIVTVVVVLVHGRIAVHAAAVIVSAVGFIEGEDVVFHDVLLAAAAKIKHTRAVLHAGVVINLIKAARQNDAADFVLEAHILNDQLVLGIVVGMDGIARMVEDQVALHDRVVGRHIDAVISAGGAVGKDHISFDADPFSTMAHFFHA